MRCGEPVFPWVIASVSANGSHKSKLEVTRPVKPNIDTETFGQQTHRTLQSEDGGGLSGDSIALMMTVLPGVGSFIVQAVTEKRAARAATATQKELDRALAARQSERNLAAMQLDRVRLQMADYVRCVFAAWTALR